MVTFASREIRGGGLIKFFIAKFILATCESREDIFCVNLCHLWLKKARDQDSSSY